LVASHENRTNLLIRLSVLLFYSAASAEEHGRARLKMRDENLA
jgi:hypothetical protein